MSRHPQADPSDNGFTLIELLVTMSIIGVLAAIGVMSTHAFRTKSVTSACVSDIRTDQLAIDTYKTKFGHYPDTEASLTGAGVINRLYDGTAYTISYVPGPSPYTTYTLSVHVGSLIAQSVPPGSGRVQNLAACVSP
jgi:prepilin-type N-terminal cleavage/methylation domain-containing protein